MQMATKENLMAFGMSPFLANRLGDTPVITSTQGATLASAKAIPGNQFTTVITATNSGSGLKLPNMGDDGSLLGDCYHVINTLGAAIQVYASGSAVMYFSGASASGDTGCTVATVNSVIFKRLTATTWYGLKAGSA
jgi:hypothetical protein